MRTQHRNTPPIFNYSPLVAAVAMALAAPAAYGATVTVTDGRDDFVIDPISEGTVPRPGTLRAAITYINDGVYINDVFTPNCTGSDTINFSGPFVITLSQQLPSLQCDGLKIQGPGRAPTVHIVGNSTISSGLYASSFATVSNLELSGFMDDCGCGTALYGRMDAIGNNVHDNSNGIDVWGSSRVDNNTVTANDYGIYVSDSYGGTVNGNKVIGNGNSDGIDIDYSSLTVAGNTVQNNYYGIYVYESSGMVVDNNSVVSPNSEAYGIDIEYSDAVATNNTVVKGGYGFYVYNSQIDLNHNFIGTDPSSNSGMGNSYGIYVGSYSYGSIASNVVSGNGTGIAIEDGDSLSITSNLVGTNVAGTAALANNTGISIYCLTASELAGNTISGNTQTGLELYGVVGTELGTAGGGSVEVRNNRIGVAGDGITALPNNAYGVYMGYGSCYSYGYGAAAKAVVMKKRSPLRAKLGGTTRAGGSSDGILFSGNTIAHNAYDGLGMSYANSNNLLSNTIRNNGGRGIFITTGTGNQILQNSIYDNFGKNLFLGGVGGTPLANDYGVNDADTGANNWQNYPDLGPIIRGSGITTVNFTLDSAVGTYRVDVYSNSSAVPGGKVWNGNTSVAVTSAAPVSGSFAIGSTTVDNISLTATRMDAGVPADTSEFSPIGFVQATPAAVVSPTSIDFGNVAMGGRSGDRGITVQSTGNAPYRIDSLRDSSCYGGTICYGGAFVCSTNCSEGASMVKGASCTISAAFAPTGLGPYSTTITICDNTALSPRNIVLTGNGVVPPPVGIDPASWNFADTLVGGRSDVKTFVITNPGTTAVPIGRVATTGDFVLDSTTCGSEIAAGSSCEANVTFVPAVQGPADGTLEVNAGGSLQPPASAPAHAKKGSAKVISELPPGSSATARLSGLGIAQAQVSLPASLDVGTQTRGEAALTRSFTLTSTGNRSLDIASITTSAPFAVTSDCPAVLPPGNACTITVSYTSNALGTFTGVLSVVTDSATGSGSIPLTARTIEVASPLIRLSSTDMGFGDRLFGTVSPTQRVTVSNVGNSGAIFAGIVTSNLDFLVSGTTCGLTLAVGAECTVDVAMRPMGFGTRTGLLLVTSNAAASPHHVNLVGTGCRPFTGAGAHSGARNNCAP